MENLNKKFILFKCDWKKSKFYWNKLGSILVFKTFSFISSLFFLAERCIEESFGEFHGIKNAIVLSF